MKKYIFIVTCLLFFCVFLSNNKLVYGEEETVVKEGQLHAKSAVLIDADSGRVLYSKNADEQMPMASTTKILTCILALEYGNFEDEVMVTSYAQAMPKVKLGIREEEKYRLKDLLYSLMLESHNDSAVAIAEHIGGSVEGFAELMNEKAYELGCYNTYFVTPNGLDDQKEVDGEIKVHSTTAKELARIMMYCINESNKKDEFLEITRTSSYSFTNISGKRNFSCTNHNAFLNMMDGALTGKTGFTNDAGYCYVGALRKDNKTYIVALLACGWPNNKSYKWSDTKTLMKYGINNFSKIDITKTPIDVEKLRNIKVNNAQTNHIGETYSVPIEIYTTQNIIDNMLLKEHEKVELVYDIKEELEAPIKKGQVVGTINYEVDGEVYKSDQIVTMESVDKVNYKWSFKKVLESFMFSQ